MKLLFFTISFIFLSIAANSQSNPGRQLNEPSYYQDPNSDALKEAGASLRKYSKQYYLGAGLMAGGCVLVFASALSTSGGGEGVGLITIGAATTLAGLLVQVLSHRHIGRAGEILERSSASNLHIQPSSSGIGLGLAYRF